jgi:hypothetical protein
MEEICLYAYASFRNAVNQKDLNLSKEWVTKAINGGVILNSTDNAMMKYTDGPNDFNRNPLHLIP